MPYDLYMLTVSRGTVRRKTSVITSVATQRVRPQVRGASPVTQPSATRSVTCLGAPKVSAWCGRAKPLECNIVMIDVVWDL